MENWINLDNLPKRKDGKIDWKNCNHNLVEFCYRDVCDYLIVEGRHDVDNVIVNFRGDTIKLPIQSLTKISLGKLFNFAVKNNYRFNIGDKIKDNRNLKIMDKIRIAYKRNHSQKGYSIYCLNCGNIFQISEANLNRGDGCSICSGHNVKVGINDLWTTRPDIASMLRDKDDGYKYMEYSNISVNFICPKCGKDIGKSFIHNVSRFGLSCHYCGSGISYPNRLMANLLNYLNADYRSEVVFDWCCFPCYTDVLKTTIGRYDFVLVDKRVIIEMDGGFGHGKDPHPYSKYSKEELIYRDSMKDKLANENGYQVIRIDCDYSSHNRLQYISDNILNSELSNIYDFSIVNWELINQSSL